MKIRIAAKKIRVALTQDDDEPEEVHTESLSTGSTLLNLAISDHPRIGFHKGKYYFLVGDSASGKTFFSMTCFAEALRNPSFKNYRLLYDNVEDGMLMDVERLFGAGVTQRIEPPSKKNGEPVHSETIEEFYFHLDDAVKKGKPFIYVLDSMDGLSSEAESDKFEEQKKAYRAGKEISGSYGDGKAKKNSAGIRKAIRGLRETGSILIVISQTRDELNATAWGPKKTRSGGRALRFYATVEIWTSCAGQITKTIRGKPRKIGTTIKLKLEKNRITGKRHEVETAIYPSYGIDDIGSCIDYLVNEGWWAKGKALATREFGKISRDKLISLCEEEKYHRKLLKTVTRCWREIDQESALKRRARYE